MVTLEPLMSVKVLELVEQAALEYQVVAEEAQLATVATGILQAVVQAAVAQQ
jgi:hypothetical protein